MLQYTTLQYTTIPYTNDTTPQLQLQLDYTNYTTLQLPLKTSSPLQLQLQLHLQLQLQLHYTTLHPAVVGEVTDQVTIATIAATPKNTAPTTFRSISGFALPSVIHNNQSLLWVSYFWNFRHRLVRYYW